MSTSTVRAGPELLNTAVYAYPAATRLEDDPIPCIRVLYGSQTGNARDVALDVARKVQVYGLSARFGTLDSFCDELLELPPGVSCPEIVAIIVVSTTGQGDVPDNVKAFWRFILRKSVPKNFLRYFKFTIFGLGDRRYPQFNSVARRLRVRLIQLAASEFFRLGLGDDQHDFGYEGELDPWLELVFESMRDVVGTSFRQVSNLELPLPDFNVSLISDSNDSCSNVVSNISGPVRLHVAGPAVAENQHCDVLYGTVVLNDRLTDENHFQDVRHLRTVMSTPFCACFISYKTHMQISLPKTLGRFLPGDVVSIHPSVPNAAQFVTDVLRKDKDTLVLVTLSQSSCLGQTYFPTSAVTLEYIFTHLLDITAVPGRFFFKVLANFTRDTQHQAKLLELSGSSLVSIEQSTSNIHLQDNKNFYYEYCKSERRSIAEILWDFYSCEVPLSFLFSIIPPIHPRKYSIASTLLWYSKELRWCLFQQHLSPLTRQLPTLGSLEEFQRTRLRWCFYEWIHRWRPLLTNFTPQLQLPQTQQVQSSEDVAVDICVAVVEQTTKLQRVIRGLCSSYLSCLTVGDKVRLTIGVGNSFGDRPSPVQITSSDPLLLICPGTGVAPCRALIQQRVLHFLGTRLEDSFEQQFRCAVGSTNTSSSDVAGTLITINPADLIGVLGFRHPQKDFLFQHEWPYLQRFISSTTGKPHIQTITAFSRLDPTKKVYVQDKLESCRAMVAPFLVEGREPIVVISGRSHPMPSQVIRALEDIVQEHLGLSREESIEYWASKRRLNRLLIDTWA